MSRSTPFALGALNMVSKLVGGFYLLVAMIWKDVRYLPLFLLSYCDLSQEAPAPHLPAPPAICPTISAALPKPLLTA